jgi:hypothetical protein
MMMFRSVVVCCLAFALAGSASAQVVSSEPSTPPVTTADITALETTLSEIRGLLGTLRTSDPTLAGEVERSLTELGDEVTYLRVRLRREGAVPRAEYSSIRDRLETLRVRARGKQAAAAPVLSDDGRIAVVPVGTEFDVRLQASLNSGTATVEQRFEATTLVDYSEGGRVIIPAGSLARGFVSSVRAAGRLERRGSLTLSFDELRIGSRSYRLRASVTQAIDGKMADDATRIGAGAVVGAIIGGILGGTRGALIGVLVGGGGTIAATEGADVDLPAGTILRIRLDQALEIATQ